MKLVWSVLAIVIGYAAVVGVIMTGYALCEQTMIHKGTPGLLVLTAIAVLGGIVGGFVTASVARRWRQLHARILGTLMLLLGLGLAATTAPEPHEPIWYHWGLAVLALPCAILGGRLRSKV